MNIMKSKKLNLVLTVLCSVFLCSCGDENDTHTVFDLGISKNTVQFEVKPSATQTIDIISNTTWTVSVENGIDWFTVSPVSGTGNATLTITAERNTGAERLATMTVTAKGLEEQKITVGQAAYKGYLYEFADYQGLDPTGELVENPDCSNGKALKILTRAGTEDRNKASTILQFGSGRYEWRIYVSDFPIGDQTSIGAFLYTDDKHELDFEIGSGRASVRNEYGAKEDEVLCYATSQGNPYMQKIMTVKKNAWHTFVLDLRLENNKYLAEWWVDGKSFTQQQLTYGEEFPFRAFVSLENLSFVGDRLPAKDNYALFDYMEYLPYEYSIKPIDPNDVDNEPEPEGVTQRWDLNEAGVIPDGWILRNGSGTASVADGYLNLTNAGESGSSLSYEAEQVGAGKYTWRIHVPAIGVTEKFLTGGSLYTEEGGEKSFSFMVFSGTAANRASCTPKPTASQVLLRCYTESGTTFKPLIPDREYTLTLDLRVKNGKYVALWLIDGELVKSAITVYDANTVKFSLSATVMANGGAWQGDIACVKDYTAKYDYIEYKKYEY
jgi:hypothetical protein